MLERHKLLMGRTQDRAGQNNGSIGVFWRSFNGIIGHIRYMFRGLKITHNHEHSSLYSNYTAVRYFWVGLPTFLGPTFLGLFIGTTFARPP